MREELLHHIWKFKRFNHHQLCSTTGEAISIINYGSHNQNAGPDFLDARIYINKTLWVGHVEMHIYSAEWDKHRHQSDLAYNNVILHVVLEDNKKVCNHNGIPLCTLELKNRIDTKVLANYQNLFNPVLSIACQASIKNYPLERLPIYLEQLLIHRLERKSHHLNSLLKRCKNNWELFTLRLLISYIGGKVNKEAFENLASKIPYRHALRMTSLSQMEALLFGLAGMLENPLDKYSKTLAKEFSFLKKKYTLQTMNPIEWRFSRMRPVNFPSIRIAQLASLIINTSKLFNKIVNSTGVQELFSLLNHQTSAYWDQHYCFGRHSKQKKKTIGKSMKTVITINVFIPVIFTYASVSSDLMLQELCLEMYSNIPPENNKIIRLWKNLGIKCQNAAHSQALIELKTQFCEPIKCLNCQIGTKLLLE